MIEGPHRPSADTKAPGTPRTRAPNTTAKFITFGPGRNWQSAKTSLNSCAVIHLRSSTAMRRAQARVPPKPKTETITKLLKSPHSVGRGAAAESGDWDMADDYRHDFRMTIDRMAK